jgi:uncharacterized protein (DUF1778 family)
MRSSSKLVTISARVPARIRALAETAAKLRGTTLSAFAARAIAEAAKGELAAEDEEVDPGEGADG